MPVICLSLLLSLTANADLDGNAARELEPIISASDVQAQLTRYIGERITPLVLTGDAKSQKERADILRELLLAEVIYKGVPGDWYQGPLEVEWTDTIETGKGYNIRKLRYEAVPGLWIAAVLYEPEQLEDKAPAVLNVNGHVGPPGKGIEYEQIRCINLTKRGCHALQPDLYTSIEAANALESLKQLIAEHRGYGEHFSLYCFGLLRESDVPELAALGP